MSDIYPFYIEEGEEAVPTIPIELILAIGAVVVIGIFALK